MTSSTHWVARVLWLAPAFLLFICGQQIWSAYTLGQTIARGMPATAQVVALRQEGRAQVKYDYMKLRVDLPDGGTLTTGKMSVPHTLVPLLKNKKRLAVFVRPGAAQEVVIREKRRSGSPSLGATQQHLAMVNAAMSGVAALLFGFGVFWWNRYLRRKGDPAAERAGQREEDYSASARCAREEE